MINESYGKKTWKDVNFEDIFPERKKARIIGMTFPHTSSSLALEPAILTVLPEGENVEFDYYNRDYNDNDVSLYLCSVYIAGLDDFIAWALKHDKNRIVVGGYHPTSFPEDFLQYAGRIVRGPCDDIRATLQQPGQVVRGVVSSKTTPRRDLYDMSNNYQIIPDKKPEDVVVSINTSAGCNMNPPCDFCCTPMMYEHLSSRPIGIVEREALELSSYHPKFMFIRDENFTMQRDWQQRLYVIHRFNPDTKLYLFASANTLKKDVIEVMAKNNVFMVCLGLEDPTKEYAKNKDLIEVVKTLKQNKIMTYLSFIVDPLRIVGKEEGKAFYKKLMDCFYEIAPEMVCGNFLMPFRGTKIWDNYYQYVSRENYKDYTTKEPFLVKNEILREKMKFFLFWYQWLYYTSDFYNENVRKFATRDTLHLRFLELYQEMVPKYLRLWSTRP
jgi:radical SAM superfamily enzyme YgiQ (UPF0313 family)